MHEIDLEYYAPRFQIVINGMLTQVAIAQSVLSVTVNQEVNKPNSFTFDVQDDLIHVGEDAQSLREQFQWLGHDLFKYGNDISIAMGYLNTLAPLMEGKIQKITAKFSDSSAPSFTIEGADRASESLTLPSDTKVFSQKTYSEMVREIAAGAKPNLRAIVDDTHEVIPRQVKKGGESYLKFLLGLAKANEGFEFALVGRDLLFRRAKKDQAAQIALAWGKNLMNFQTTLNTGQAITEVIVRAWDKAGKKMIEGRAGAGDEQIQEEGKRLASQVARDVYGDVVKVVTDKPVRNEAEAKKEAKAILDKAGDNLITARGETMGMPELQPGVCVELAGLGSWFSGKYYVNKVTHRFDQNGYRSNFEAKRNAI